MHMCRAFCFCVDGFSHSVEVHRYTKHWTANFGLIANFDVYVGVVIPLVVTKDKFLQAFYIWWEIWVSRCF